VFFRQFKVEGLGCLSYLIGCPKTGQAFVIDPKFDIQEYLDVARRERMRIVGIIETHLHADHVSGAPALREETGAPLYFGEGTPVSYGVSYLKDGAILTAGSVKMQVFFTPGHTPHSITIAVTDLSRGPMVQLLLTGDLLFVGSVGRPDLAGEDQMERQIADLYRSLHEILGQFEDPVEIYPAHGEGSACGQGLSSKTSSTLGYERGANPFFSLEFEAFKDRISIIFRHPKNFFHVIQTNRRGDTSLHHLSPLVPLSVHEIRQSLEDHVVVVDLREASCFGGAHLPGSINIGFSAFSASWLADIVDPALPLVLVASTEREAKEAAIMFYRAGYHHIKGYCTGVMGWILSGGDTGFLPQISVHALHHVLKKYEDHLVLDVRTKEEWEEGRIASAVHLPIHTLLEETFDLSVSREAHISVLCRSGYRSNIAASILKSRGYSHVYSVIGGMTAWKRVFGEG